MKKFALATLLALVAVTASAVEVRVEGADADGKNGSPNQNIYELSVKESINKNFAGDLTVNQSRTEGTHALANRTEAGVTASTSYAGSTPYARVAIGQKFINNQNSFGYYSIEPGVSVPVATTGATVSLGYRFREAFNDNNADTTRTWRAKLGYDINSTNNVYVGYDRERGDTQQNITKVGYIHAF